MLMATRTQVVWLAMACTGASIGCQDILGVDVPVAAVIDAASDTSDASTPDATPGPACSDGEQNNDESDVDCGGSCPGCVAGNTCSSHTDCQGGLFCESLCRLPASCNELQQSGVTTDGMHTIDPDGDDDQYGPLAVICDMTTDGGGWTLVGDYRSELELFTYQPLAHQQQTTSGGMTLAAPPVLDGTTNGHLAYDAVPGAQVRLQCLPEGAADWFSSISDLFTDWQPGDKGSYGAAQWGIVGYESFGRGSHFICGLNILTDRYFGVALCSGPGQSGSFTNHLVSLSFNPNLQDHGGGLSIGCNGLGLDLGKSAQWRARVWSR